MLLLFPSAGFTESNFAARPSTDPANLQKRARENLANKLFKLSRSLDMREASFKESGGSGGKDFNSNDANSYMSDTTYHSYVWSYCLDWIGGQYCNKWLDPYIAGHGFGADRSPLEGKMANLWKNMKSEGDSEGNRYAIWQVERPGGGSNLDVQGKFDRNGLSDWRLLPDVKKEAEKIGEETAIKNISITYDDNTGKGENTMPNMESLRLMASRWTKMLRNRMVANIGELRAMDVPVEAALGEDIPECADYERRLQTDQEMTKLQERIQAQPVLDPVTQSTPLDARLEACRALRAARVDMINAKTDGKKVEEGNVDEEQIDKWKSRLNLQAIDQAGVDITQIPRPSSGQLKPEDIATKLRLWKTGGTEYTEALRTNRWQLESYNANLQNAANGMKSVATRSPWIKDISETILSYKIKPGTTSAVRINHLTPEMKAELRETGFPFTGKQNDPKDPTLNLEMTPSELVQRANQR